MRSITTMTAAVAIGASVVLVGAAAADPAAAEEERGRPVALGLSAEVTGGPVNVGRKLEVTLRTSAHATGKVWVARDRRAGACPAVPARMPAGAGWLLGRPGAGVPIASATRRNGRPTWDLASPVRPHQHGRIRVCAWARVDPEAGGRRTAPTWITARALLRAQRLVPTRPERWRLRQQIRVWFEPVTRMWGRRGSRMVIRGPRFSRVDPAFAYVEVGGATPADAVPGAHTFAHFADGRWRLLERPAKIDGDPTRWCPGESRHLVRPPLPVVREFLGRGTCPGAREPVRGRSAG